MIAEPRKKLELTPAVALALLKRESDMHVLNENHSRTDAKSQKSVLMLTATPSLLPRKMEETLRCRGASVTFGGLQSLLGAVVRWLDGDSENVRKGNFRATPLARRFDVGQRLSQLLLEGPEVRS